MAYKLQFSVWLLVPAMKLTALSANLNTHLWVVRNEFKKKIKVYRT